MFKKVLLVAAVALSTTAFADGFYAGAGLGGSSLHVKLTDSGNNHSGNYGSTDVVGGLLGGYSFNMANQVNLGVEAFFNGTSDKISQTNANGSSDVKLRYNYGVRVLPGYQLTPDTDMHLIAGYVRGNFKFDSSDTDSSASPHYNRNGYQAGFGLGTNVDKNVFLRADMIYSGYNKISGNNEDSQAVSLKANTLDAIVSGGVKFG